MQKPATKRHKKTCWSFKFGARTEVSSEKLLGIKHIHTHTRIYTYTFRESEREWEQVRRLSAAWKNSKKALLSHWATEREREQASAHVQSCLCSYEIRTRRERCYKSEPSLSFGIHCEIENQNWNRQQAKRLNGFQSAQRQREKNFISKS